MNMDKKKLASDFRNKETAVRGENIIPFNDNFFNKLPPGGELGELTDDDLKALDEYLKSQEDGRILTKRNARQKRQRKSKVPMNKRTYPVIKKI